MAHTRRWTRAAAILPALTGLLLGVILVLGNSRYGRTQIERLLPRMTDGAIALRGIGGRFPDALRIAAIEVRGDAGVWLSIENMELDWSPLRLLLGDAAIELLQADRVTLQRLPTTDGEAGNRSIELPLHLSLQRLQVSRLELGASVAGTAASLEIQGSARIRTLEDGAAELSARRLDAPGSYSLRAQISVGALRGALSADEPTAGLLASFAGLPQLGPLALDAALDGPKSAASAHFELAAGALRTRGTGRLDWVGQALDLDVSASAPAMQPGPDLSWQSLAVNARVNGPIAQAHAKGAVHLEGLRAAGLEIERITADLAGDQGQLQLLAQLDGLRLPAPLRDLLRPTPLKLQAHARLDAPGRPIAFSLQHPLLSADGKVVSAADTIEGETVLRLPELAPVGRALGIDLRGSSTAKLRLVNRDDETRLQLQGSLGIVAGEQPLPALLGDKATFTAVTTIKGSDVLGTRAQLDGKAVTLTVDGDSRAKRLDFHWKLGLSELSAWSTAVTGRIGVEGRIEGARDDFGLTATLTGMVEPQAVRAGTLTARLRIAGLPRSPSAALQAEGSLAGSPLHLELSADRRAGQAPRIEIGRLAWNSITATGALTVTPGSQLPVGRIDLQIVRLEDLRGLVKRAVSGSVAASLETTNQSGRAQARLNLKGRDLALEDIVSVGNTTLAATVDDPLGRPSVDGRLGMEAILAGTATGSAELGFSGPGTRLALQLAATAKTAGGSPAKILATGAIDAAAQALDLKSLEASWRGESSRLVAPARIGFARGLESSRLRMGLRSGWIEASGRLSPTLDLNMMVRDLPAELARVVFPELAAEGLFQADARLQGELAQPRGDVRLDLSGFKFREGAAGALPQAHLSANAELMGDHARIDGRLDLGAPAVLKVAGELPLTSSGDIDLRTDGAFDLKLLDPLLNARGRRVRGLIELGGGLAGTPEQPRITGTLRWNKGELQDYSLGTQLRDIAAVLQADGEQLRISHFEARSGAGRIAVSGAVGVLAPGLPLELRIIARHARPLATDRLNVDISSDLWLRGPAAGALTATGSVLIHRAEIRIPERMPARVAIIDVRRPGEPPSPPPAPGPALKLDLRLDALSAIFVRGRGLDAEMSGRIHLQGTADDPEPIGVFAMRRGELRLAGRSLDFRKGAVGFEGGRLTDPSLDFVANTTSEAITATLTIEGTARKPKITLSSSPELPQDEILARLLFGRSAASLGPLELAQIAGAIASLTGVSSSLGDPLEGARQRLGLDRLTVGTSAGGPTLEGGRYVAPGVYLGGRQAFAGTGTQATVQVDVTEGLKLEGSVGTAAPSSKASGSTSVGVIYQFEY